jgi:outer membrane protein assembly factor BamB
MISHRATAWLKSVVRRCGLFLLGCLLCGCQSTSEMPLTTVRPTPTREPLRIPGESTLGLTELWRFHTDRSNYIDSTFPSLPIAGDRVIFSYREYDDWEEAVLVALRLDTGQIIWQTHLVNSLGGTSIDASYLDKERVYLIYSFRVNAFSLETGELLWSTLDPERPGGHTGYYLLPWDPSDPLLVHSSEDEVLALDPRSGAILYRRPEANAYTNIRYAQVEFVNTLGGLQVVDLQTGRTLWRRISTRERFNTIAVHWPSFVDDDIIFQVGQPCYTITRVAIRTGRTVWQTLGDNYLSNVAISGSRLYALREDLMLVAFDIETGTVMGTLQFSGPPAATICAKGGGDAYWLATNGPYLVVYFSDTGELITFKQVIPSD